MEIVQIDEGSIVGEMTKARMDDSSSKSIFELLSLQVDAEFISFGEFKEWSIDVPSNPEKKPTFVDPFGNTDILPDRFEDPSSMVHKSRSQHPCYTTSYNDLGARAPSDADMPTKWRGRDGVFTDTFVYDEPGKGMQVSYCFD